MTSGEPGAGLYVLRTEQTQCVLSAAIGARPRMVYWGPPLAGAPPETLILLATRQHAHGGPATDLTPSLMNETGAGRAGQPGLIVHRGGADWAPVLTVRNVRTDGAAGVEIECLDRNTHICVRHRLALDPDCGLLTASTTLTNIGDATLSLDRCAAMCLPLDDRFTDVVTFTGRWGLEFQQQRTKIFHGAILRENRRGRTSHDCFPGAIACAPHTGEQAGPAAGFHLGWSGNHYLCIDRSADGRAFAQLGELFLPGEMTLAPEESYATPTLFAARADNGRNALSQQFHHHLEHRVMNGRTRAHPRPVHFNTWEATYFDHDEQRLMALADKAAAIGAERFVLDDGWFGARRHDGAGLGDWRVAEAIFPDGLAPLADHVRALGMTFGIWFEPEMANPDSDLLRAYPDWTLGAPGADDIPSRNQLPLDLSRSEICDHLFHRMGDIIAATGARYVKWDMNRDLHHPGSAGRPVAHKHTRALYALMDRLRRAFPKLEIESCASGGGRMDFGVLRYCDRVWLSDCNDALDRQHIQRGASYFFPPSVLGAHVGPAPCHTTGRVHTMAFRAATAMFGHMGLELDLETAPARDLTVLRAAIALYKEHRALLHGGKVYRLETPDDILASGVVCPSRRDAIYSCATVKSRVETAPARLRLAGLDPDARYRLRLVWPAPFEGVTAPSIVDAADLADAGHVFTGAALMHFGVQLPIVFPETCLIFTCSAED